MGFDLSTAMPISEKETIPTTSFDLSTAKPVNSTPPKEKLSPISSVLRAIFRNSPLEKINTSSYYLENIKDMPKPEEGERFTSWYKKTSEALRPREEEIIKEGVLRQVEVPIQGAIASSGFSGTGAILKTAGAVGAFSIADHFFNARRWLEKNAPNTPPTIMDVVEIADFVVKGAAIGGGFKLGKKFVARRMNELNLPKSVSIPPENIDAIKTNEVAKKTLGINDNHISASENSGSPIEVSVDKVMDLAEKPEWNQLKNDIGIEVKEPDVLMQLKKEVATNKVMKALKEAEPIRGLQEELYTKERGQRMARALGVGEKTGGERGFGAELGQLKGELPKAQFEAIRKNLKQEDIDILFDSVKESPDLTFWETISARTGLGKLFGEYGGTVPTKSELSLLNKVFGDEFVQTLLDKRPFWEKARDEIASVINFPRTIMASFDLSAPFRQGLFFVGRKEFRTSFGDMFKSFASEKYFGELQKEIRTRPTYDKMVQSKLSLTGTGALLEGREEAFMSKLAEKVPGVRMSERAYVGFLNKLRADTFDSMYKNAERSGLNPAKNADLVKQISGFINAATGRGGLGRLERVSVELNEVFFSPRLISSRLSLLNPYYYASRDPFVRKEALKSLFGMTAFVSTALGIAKLSGAEVGLDPRSSDFLKAKIGNTRIDFLGGFQQYMRMAGQIISGQYVSSTTGKITTLGEGYKPITRTQIIGRGIRSKLSPFASFLLTELDGIDWKGKKIDQSELILENFKPMVIQDMVELYNDDPNLLPLELLAIFGVGVQTYGKVSQRKKSPGKSRKADAENK